MEATFNNPEQLLKEISLLKKEIRILIENRNRHLELEEILNHERELYLDLANASPLGIYRIRTLREEAIQEEIWHNVESGPYKIEFVNNRFCEILDINKQAFEKNPAILHDLIFEADKAEFIRNNVEANIHINPFMWEGRFTCKGEIIWVHFESIPRVLENNDILWTGILNDITVHRKADDELELRNQELQHLNAEKDKFLSIIAHDLKSPFNSILGFSGILLEKVYEKDLPKIQEYAEIINDSSQRAMNLLLNLMEWSQSQTGRLNFNPGNFNLAAMIDEIIELFATNALQKSISITKELPAEIPVYADKAMLGTIVRNLLSNALKFTQEGGSIHIIAEVSNGKVTILVKDTGVGIEKSVMERIFHIDSSFSTPDTQGNKGTGLGLLLCKEFTDRHQGTIGIDSEPGKGSVFHFTIPVHNDRSEKDRKASHTMTVGAE